jgi:hypothetical protein
MKFLLGYALIGAPVAYSAAVAISNVHGVEKRQLPAAVPEAHCFGNWEYAPSLEGRLIRLAGPGGKVKITNGIPAKQELEVDPGLKAAHPTMKKMKMRYLSPYP